MRPSFRGRPGDPKEQQRANDWTGTLFRVWRYLSESRGMLSIVLVMVFLSSAFGLLGPYLIGATIDHFIVPKRAEGLTGQLLLLAAVYFLYSLTTWLENYWMVSIAQKTVYKMRTQLFRQFHKLAIPFFDKRQHGELMSRVTNDIDNVSQTLNSSAIQIFSSVLTLIGTVAVMLWLSPLLTLLTMLIIPIMFFGMRWITNRTGKMFKKQQQNMGEMNGFIEETISGQKIVKTFSQEDRVIQRFQEKNKQLKESGFWAQTYSGFIPKLMNVLNNLSFAVIAGVGGYLALHGFISIGTIVVFTEYSRQFTRPLNDLSNQFNTILSAVAGAERVFEILDMEEEASDEKSAEDIGRVTGRVEFQHVSFSYEDSLTLDDISFTIQPGETVAFVGATGAGKTTITNLLSRFYDAQNGEIFIDGKEIKAIKRSSLRSQMGFVLQDSFLFQGSIRENIRYGRLDATDEEVEQAAGLANASGFIEKLPDQYETLLKQDGSGISQGQKQLISIARAILSKPAILILDEATSSIDTITEMNIQEALQRLMDGRTSFVIAHRLNTIQKADHILVLENGRIVESGTHNSLLQKRGYYYGLYNSQLEEFSS